MAKVFDCEGQAAPSNKRVLMMLYRIDECASPFQGFPYLLSGKFRVIRYLSLRIFLVTFVGILQISGQIGKAECVCSASDKAFYCNQYSKDEKLVINLLSLSNICIPFFSTPPISNFSAIANLKITSH